jgi:DNA primase
MGTALNARHIKKLKGIASRVVLVFDADAGGEGGVDRAMEVFVSHDLDLRVASLPEGLDPCDLLTARGPEPFRQALEQAVDVFEHKLQRVWAKHADRGLDGKRLAAEEMLNIMALTPTESSVKLELMVNRIAHRLSIKEDTVWARLRELRAVRKKGESHEEIRPPETNDAPPDPPRAGPAALHERELVELLLAEPTFVSQALIEVPPEEIEHPGLRKIAEALYRLQAEGQPANLDRLHGRLDNDRLWERCRQLQDRGLDYPDRPEMFRTVLDRFRARREQLGTQDLIDRIKNEKDPAKQLNLMRQLQDRKSTGIR